MCVSSCVFLQRWRSTCRRRLATSCWSSTASSWSWEERLTSRAKGRWPLIGYWERATANDEAPWTGRRWRTERRGEESRESLRILVGLQQICQTTLRLLAVFLFLNNGDVEGFRLLNRPHWRKNCKNWGRLWKWHTERQRSEEWRRSVTLTEKNLVREPPGLKLLTGRSWRQQDEDTLYSLSSRCCTWQRKLLRLYSVLYSVQCRLNIKFKRHFRRIINQLCEYVLSSASLRCNKLFAAPPPRLEG